MKQLLFLILSFFLFSSCKKGNQDERNKFWVVNYDGFIDETKTSEKGIPPPPPQRQDLKWYTNIVFIMDSKNKVYVYQTETIRKYNKELKNKINSKPIYKYKFPNYIGLKPEHLLTFDSKNFVTFLKENNDLFEISGNNQKNRHSIIYIVSDCDTIKNRAFYDFGKIIDKEKHFAFIVRKTTEEENHVLEFKRKKHEYAPEKINWSTNFIDGKTKPFTEDYKKLEEKVFILRKAKSTFVKGNLEFYPGCAN